MICDGLRRIEERFISTALADIPILFWLIHDVILTGLWNLFSCEEG